MSELGTAAARRGAERSRVHDRSRVLELVGFALLAYVPFLLSSPGKVSADTKQYLYLDPGRFLDRVPYLWDAHVGLGTVPHQQIGYLFPMGPYFWLMDVVGVPDWIAQRLWLGTITLIAALAARWLFRMLGIGRIGAAVGALVYMLTPYQLAFTARISVLLLAWAALPLLVGFAIRATRHGGWMDPALFALTLFTIASVNASAVELVIIAPAAWLVVEVCRGRAERRAALVAATRIVVLSLGVSLWWVIALRTQAVYGLPVLDLTETVRTVAELSTPIDILRGLGNWFFYGRDRLGQSLEQAEGFSDSGLVLFASYAVPVLALVAAAVVRWRYRGYFILLVVVGVVVGVGAWPYDGPSAYGRLFRAFANETALGLALRNTPRVVPVLVLGMAALLGAGVSALAPRSRQLGGALAVAILVLLAFAPVWRFGYFSEGLERPEDLPSYWTAAARALDEEGGDTRVLEVPGSNFSAYRWGNTIEPVTPGLTERDYVAREVLPAGTPGAVNLLHALDHRIQEGTFEPDSLAPVARMMAAGTVVLRSDLEYERFDTARPRRLWDLLTRPLAPGLDEPQHFGEPRPNRASASLPLLDALELSTPTTLEDPPPVALFGVSDPVPIVHTAPRARPVVLSGDAEGIVDAAEVGLVDGRQLVLESAALNDEQLDDAAAAGADFVLTDTNRWRTQTYFDRIRDAVGFTQRDGTELDEFRLEVFPDAGDTARTFVETRGGIVDATGYVTPTDRPANAFDGDLRTAWLVDGSEAEGARVSIRPDEPVRADRVTLVQRRSARVIRAVRIHVDDEPPIDVDLGRRSLASPGVTITFPERDVRNLAVEITDISTPRNAPPSGVGFSEVTLGNARVQEAVRLPVELTRRLGDDLDSRRLDVVLSRQRYEPSQRLDEEPTLDRRIVIPGPRDFGLSGTVRVEPNAPDPTIDEVLGTTAPNVTFSSSEHLFGVADSRASRAFDGDPRTAWTAGYGRQEGDWIDVDMAAPVTIDRLDLTMVDDGRHSVPTQVHLEADGVPVRTMTVGPISAISDDGTRKTASLAFDPVTAQSLRLVVDSVRATATSQGDDVASVDLPVAIAELDFDGAPRPASPADVPATCRDDLVVVDGSAVPVRAVGQLGDARRGLGLETCSGPVQLRDGSNTVRTRPGLDTGLDIDRIVLSSNATGGAAPVEVLGAPLDASGAEVRIVDSGPTSYRLEVETNGRPFWVVLGQSHSDGWEAVADGESLGAPVLVDGFANGWQVSPSGAGTIAIELTWTPQRVVWVGIAVSIGAVLACLALIALTWRRRTARATDGLATLADAPVEVSAALYRGRAPSTRALVVMALGLTIGVSLVSRLWIGVLVGVVTVIACRASRGRLLLSGGAPLALALGALVDAPELGWVAIGLLAADAVVGWWIARGGDDRDEPRESNLDTTEVTVAG